MSFSGSAAVMCGKSLTCCKGLKMRRGYALSAIEVDRIVRTPSAFPVEERFGVQ